MARWHRQTSLTTEDLGRGGAERLLLTSQLARVSHSEGAVAMPNMLQGANILEAFSK